MGLDLIPRVDGEVVDADSTSVVELYKVVSLYRSLKLRSIIILLYNKALVLALLSAHGHLSTPGSFLISSDVVDSHEGSLQTKKCLIARG